jgi:soluble lytic murein transglycosylase
MSVGSSYTSSSRRARAGYGSRGGGRRRGAYRRRRTLGTIVAIAFTALLVGWLVQHVEQADRTLGLPLSHASIIRQQAADKHLDPALIAAVIYAETKFDPRTSSAGAEGLMQILPATAGFIAHRSGGVRFTTSDLATPAINVAYGSYYLRYLIDHYQGDVMLAVAAYNGGLANVDAWVAGAAASGHKLSISAIPFPETRAYVQRVLQAERDYRATYPHQLGLG